MRCLSSISSFTDVSPTLSADLRPPGTAHLFPPALSPGMAALQVSGSDVNGGLAGTSFNGTYHIPLKDNEPVG